MKLIKNTIILSCLLALVTSCYEEEQWLEDNIETEGKNYPVIQSVGVEGELAPGNTLNLIMHYWSSDPILRYDLYDSVAMVSNQQLYSSTDYVYNYDEETGSEVVTLPYTIPSTVVDTSIVILRVAIVNENGLSREVVTSLTFE